MIVNDDVDKTCLKCSHLRVVEQETNMNDGGYLVRYICTKAGVREIGVDEVDSENDCVFFEPFYIKIKL